MSNLDFKVQPGIKEIGIKGIYFTIEGMENATNNVEFDIYKNTVINKLNSVITEDYIKSDVILRGFRDLHQKVNVSNRKFVSSSESLLNYFLKRREPPTINLIVDIYNLISLKSKLALGAHDIKNINEIKVIFLHSNTPNI